jgi:hypothetical protein
MTLSEIQGGSVGTALTLQGTKVKANNKVLAKKVAVSLTP